MPNKVKHALKHNDRGRGMIRNTPSRIAKTTLGKTYASESKNNPHFIVGRVHGITVRVKVKALANKSGPKKRPLENVINDSYHVSTLLGRLEPTKCGKLTQTRRQQNKTTQECLIEYATESHNKLKQPKTRRMLRAALRALSSATRGNAMSRRPWTTYVDTYEAGGCVAINLLDLDSQSSKQPGWPEKENAGPPTNKRAKPTIVRWIRKTVVEANTTRKIKGNSLKGGA
ncbi:hypothetical protein ACFE04_014003 [Oxalis oulophora]